MLLLEIVCVKIENNLLILLLSFLEWSSFKILFFLINLNDLSLKIQLNPHILYLPFQDDERKNYWSLLKNISHTLLHKFVKIYEGTHCPWIRNESATIKFLSAFAWNMSLDHLYKIWLHKKTINEALSSKLIIILLDVYWKFGI